MSYDVGIGDESFNYTYNLGAFFRDFGVGPIADLEGVSGSQVATRIDLALTHILSRSVAELEEYDAPNGWGSWSGATIWLMQIRDAGKANPDAVVEVW
jgi:hypothetical protein